MKDQLFFLPADFQDDGAAWYCRECAEVRGLLTYYPQLSRQIDVQVLDFPRPRSRLVELLGEAHQNLPTLIVGDEGGPPPASAKQAKGRFFFDDAASIGEYLAAKYGIGRPHL
jgi:hypothetical protein